MISISLCQAIESAPRSVLGIELDDAYPGGERTGCKPGRGADGKTPFVAVVETTHQGQPIRIKINAVKGFSSAEILAWSQQHLVAGSIVISDGLACFNAVVEAGCQHDKIVPNYYPT